MEESFMKFYLRNNGSNSKHTESAMLMNMKRLEKVIGKPFDKIKLKDLQNPEELTAMLMSQYALATTISTILAIRHIIKFLKGSLDLRDQYDLVLKELVAQRTENAHTQEKSEKEEENWIPYPELKQKVLDLAPKYLDGKKPSYTQFRNFMLLALYTLQPPSRIGNYLDMGVRDKTNMKRDGGSLNKKNNYLIHLGDGKYEFIFNKYKTSKSVGQVRNEIKDETLNKILHRYIEEYQRGKTFLSNTNGSPMSQTAVSNALKSITKKELGKELSLNGFRHIFLTHFLSTNPSIEEKKRVLTLVGHKFIPSQAELYQRF